MANARGGDRGDVPALYMWVEVLAVTLLLASLVFAQGAPRVTTVEPSSGKVNDNITLTGDHLGKDSVSVVFLSDEKDDFKAVVVEQTDNKIIIKVPQGKARQLQRFLSGGRQNLHRTGTVQGAAVKTEQLALRAAWSRPSRPLSGDPFQRIRSAQAEEFTRGQKIGRSLPFRQRTKIVDIADVRTAS